MRENLKAARKAADLTQQAMADKPFRPPRPGEMKTPCRMRQHPAGHRQKLKQSRKAPFLHYSWKRGKNQGDRKSVV